MRKKILVAEDNASFQMLLKHKLAPQYAITEVANGLDFEDALQNEQFDLVIADLNLPEKSGTQVLRRAGAIRMGNVSIEGIGVPTIVVTGMDPEDEYVVSVRRMTNVYKVFNKPADLYSIMQAISEVLDTPSTGPKHSNTAKKNYLSSVLAIDNKPENLEKLSLELESHGIQMRMCLDTERAVDLCQTHAFDLIILHERLGESSRETAVRLQGNFGATVNPIIILVTDFPGNHAWPGFDTVFDAVVDSQSSVAVLTSTVLNVLRECRVPVGLRATSCL